MELYLWCCSRVGYTYLCTTSVYMGIYDGRQVTDCGLISGCVGKQSI